MRTCATGSGRYSISGWAQRLDPAGSFPIGTLTVNVLGCLAIGLLAGLAEARALLGPEARLFVLIGLLGGFTTFSTFGHETLALVRAGSHGAALLNALGSVTLCLVAVWLGYGFGSTR